MATVINRMRSLERVVERKLKAGIREAVEVTAVEYSRDVTKVQEPGPPFEGPHSSPGQFPFRETGQGASNIGSGVRGLEGRAGVKDSATGRGPRPPHKIRGGMHLYWLTLRGRKGIDASMLENLPKIRFAAILKMRERRGVRS